MTDHVDQVEESAILTEIDRRLTSSSFTERVQLLYRRVEFFLRSGKYSSAVEDIETLQLLDPSAARKTLMLLHDCYSHLEDSVKLAAVEARLNKLSSCEDNATSHVSVSFNTSSSSIPRLHPAIEAAVISQTPNQQDQSKAALAEAARQKQFAQLRCLVQQSNDEVQQQSNDCSSDWCVVTAVWWRVYVAYLVDGGADEMIFSLSTNSGVSSVVRLNANADAEELNGRAVTADDAHTWQMPADMNVIGGVPISDPRLDFVLVPYDVWRALCIWCTKDSYYQQQYQQLQCNEEENSHEATDVDVLHLPAEEMKSLVDDWITLDEVLLSLNAPQQRRRSASVSSTVGERKSRTQQLCGVCRRQGLLRCSKCKSMLYCSPACQAVHWRYHKVTCNSNNSSVAADGSARGVAGLANLGNSCYLNSSLQCLSHIFPLTRYFISGQYEGDVNKDSRDGAQGELAKEYALLLRDMWLKNRTAGTVVVFPTAVKRVLGRLNADYASLQQQDAHDVLEMLLDRLHEDVNLIHKKPYCEKAEGDGSNDLEVSKEAWHKHGLRNRSLVGDIVGGMLRSYLRCPVPTCHRTSVTFDYHNTLQLAIPNMSSLRISVVWLPITSSAPLSPGSVSPLVPYRIVLEIDRLSSVLALKRDVCRKLMTEKQWTNVEGVKLDDITLLLLERTATCGFTASRLLDDDDSLSAITGIESSEVGMYWAPPNPRLRGTAVILQSLPEQEGQQTSLASYPLLVPFDYEWSLLRFRCEVWQQVSRAVRRDTLAGFASQGNMACDLRMGQRIPLRYCNRFGESFELKKPVTTTAVSESTPVDAASAAPTAGLHGKVTSEEMQWMSKAGLSADAQCAAVGLEANYFRGLLPTNKDITLHQVLGHADPNSIPFFCVAWSDMWLPYINTKELSYVSGAAMSADGAAARRDQLTLHRCLQHFTSEEILDEDNAWYCSHCKEHRQAHKKLSFWHLPDVLIIGLKRFEYRSRASMHELGRPRFSSYREKIDTYVDFPIDGLDMSPYCEPHSDSLGGSTIYDLFAVCNHYGRMGFGHYVAMARSWDASDESREAGELGDEWYCYDDESVQPIDEKAVKSNAAYILFYRRRK